MTVLSWPSGLREPNQCDFWPEDLVVENRSVYDGSTEVLPRFHVWHAVLVWTNTEADDGFAVEAFLRRLSSKVNQGLVPNFKVRKSVGTKTGTVTLNGAHSAGETGIAITGGSGSFAAGDFFHLNGFLYGVDTDEAGGNIVVSPGLRKAFASGTLFHFNSAGEVHDTMELVSAIGPAFGLAVPVRDYGGLIAPRTVEFQTALRPGIM